MTSTEDITPINWEDVLVQNAELRAEILRLQKENRGLTETIEEWQEIHGTFVANPELERLRALVQEHITVHHCLVCGSAAVKE